MANAIKPIAAAKDASIDESSPVEGIPPDFSGGSLNTCGVKAFSNTGTFAAPS